MLSQRWGNFVAELALGFHCKSIFRIINFNFHAKLDFNRNRMKLITFRKSINLYFCLGSPLPSGCSSYQAVAIEIDETILISASSCSSSFSFSSFFRIQINDSKERFLLKYQFLFTYKNSE